MILNFDIFSNISDILKQSNNIIECRYSLNDTPNKAYTIYSLLLCEQTFKLSVINDRTQIIR